MRQRVQRPYALVAYLVTSANFGRVSVQTNMPRVAQLKVRVEF